MIRAFIHSQTRHINDYSQALHIYGATVAASICDISIVTRYVTMSLPSILVNYDRLSKLRMNAPKKESGTKWGMSLFFFFFFPSWWSTIIGLEIYYKNKMSVIWKAEEIQET